MSIKQDLWSQFGSPRLTKEYTCGCGIYVHPERWDRRAIHMTGCPWDLSRMSKSVEKRLAVQKSSASHGPDLRKEFEDWHKKQFGWKPARDLGDGYSSYELTATARYIGFCAGYDYAITACAGKGIY